MANYSYPRVTTSVKALSHARVAEVAEDTTILFAPIIADKGPIDEITAIHSVAELIQKFRDLKYEDNGQMALNIYNWLYNGGTLYTYRLDMGERLDDAKNAEETVTVSAKYPGEFYDEMTVK